MNCPPIPVMMLLMSQLCERTLPMRHPLCSWERSLHSCHAVMSWRQAHREGSGRNGMTLCLNSHMTKCPSGTTMHPCSLRYTQYKTAVTGQNTLKPLACPGWGQPIPESLTRFVSWVGVSKILPLFIQKPRTSRCNTSSAVCSAA